MPWSWAGGSCHGSRVDAGRCHIRPYYSYVGDGICGILERKRVHENLLTSYPVKQRHHGADLRYLKRKVLTMQIIAKLVVASVNNM